MHFAHAMAQARFVRSEHDRVQRLVSDDPAAALIWSVARGQCLQVLGLAESEEAQHTEDRDAFAGVVHGEQESHESLVFSLVQANCQRRLISKGHV